MQATRCTRLSTLPPCLGKLVLWLKLHSSQAAFMLLHYSTTITHSPGRDMAVGRQQFPAGMCQCQCVYVPAGTYMWTYIMPGRARLVHWSGQLSARLEH